VSGWGSPLVQEKYQEEKACDRRHTYRIIIIIIIITVKPKRPLSNYHYILRNDPEQLISQNVSLLYRER